MILGLGLTQNLTGIVTVFLSRHKARVRAIPLLWALSVFILQIQFWWAVNELEGVVMAWTMPRFVIAVLLPLALFGASAIMLPKKQIEEETDQAVLFERDGRWGLVCLSAYGALAMVANYLLFDSPPWSSSALMAVQAILPATYLVLRSARSRAVVTMAHLAAVVAALVWLSPSQY